MENKERICNCGRLYFVDEDGAREIKEACSARIGKMYYARRGEREVGKVSSIRNGRVYFNSDTEYTEISDFDKLYILAKDHHIFKEPLRGNMCPCGHEINVPNPLNRAKALLSEVVDIINDLE